MKQRAAKARSGAKRQLISRREARDILGGISLPTLDKWCREGRLDAVRLGAHRVFITRSSLEHFIKNAERVR